MCNVKDYYVYILKSTLYSQFVYILAIRYTGASAAVKNISV